MTLWRESVAWAQQLPAIFGLQDVMLLAHPGRWLAHPEIRWFMRHMDARHKSIGRRFSDLLLLTASFMCKTVFILNRNAFWEFLRRLDQKKKQGTKQMSVFLIAVFLLLQLSSIKSY